VRLVRGWHSRSTLEEVIDPARAVGVATFGTNQQPPASVIADRTFLSNRFCTQVQRHDAHLFLFGTLLFLTYHVIFFLTIKPTRCTYFSNLFLEWKSTCFGQFLCPSSGVFHCTHSNGICHTVLGTACEQGQDGPAVPSRSCSQAVSKPAWHTPLLCVQQKTPDDGQRNCPKHVEFYFKNKFEKLVHLVGFIVRNLTRCRVTWTSNMSRNTSNPSGLNFETHW